MGLPLYGAQSPSVMGHLPPGPRPTQPSKGGQRGGPPRGGPAAHFPLDGAVLVNQTLSLPGRVSLLGGL